MIHIALSLDDSHRIDSESDILKALRFWKLTAQSRDKLKISAYSK